MSASKSGQPSRRRAGDWFVHTGECEGELESTTSASQRHVLNLAAALGKEHRMPLAYKGREQKAGNFNFPFSSHDNRHDICNAAEYFDLGMGVRKFDAEKQKEHCTNFFDWSPADGSGGSDDFLTVYQTSFAADRTPGNTEGCCCRRYPKQHTQGHCSNKPAPEDGEDLQPYETS